MHGLPMHMHAHMHMHVGRTSLPLGTRISTDLRFCCAGMPAVAGVCHHLCGDGGCGGPLEWDGAGVRLLRRLGVRGTCCLVRGYMVPGARCMVSGTWCTVSHGARCTLHLRDGDARPLQQHRVEAERGAREQRGHGRLREQAGREGRAAPAHVKLRGIGCTLAGIGCARDAWGAATTVHGAAAKVHEVQPKVHGAAAKVHGAARAQG